MRRVWYGLVLAAAVMVSAGVAGVGLTDAAVITETASGLPAGSEAEPEGGDAANTGAAPLLAIDDCTYPDDCESEREIIRCDLAGEITVFPRDNDQASVNAFAAQACPELSSKNGEFAIAVTLGGSSIPVITQLEVTSALGNVSGVDLAALDGTQGAVTTTIVEDDCIVIATITGTVDVRIAHGSSSMER